MSEQTAQEPTMEEILASIRRIISEDDVPESRPEAKAEAAPVAAPVQLHPEPVARPASPALMDETPSHEEDDVLELTQRWEEPAPLPRPTQVETIGDIEIEPSPFPSSNFPGSAPHVSAAETPASGSSFDESDRLMSHETAERAASSFAQFADRFASPAGGGRSFEDVVSEMMRPMLQAWLEQHLPDLVRESMRGSLREWFDRNLPAIVEAQVRAEVEKIAHRGAR